MPTGGSVVVQKRSRLQGGGLKRGPLDGALPGGADALFTGESARLATQ
jgi:hypothetical protein